LKTRHLIDREVDDDDIKMYPLKIRYEKVNRMKLIQDPKMGFCGDAYVHL
jgi:hypothetical protein